MTSTRRDTAWEDAQLQRAFRARSEQPTAGHPSEDDWARFAANEMPSVQRLQLADHVVSCKDCGAIFRVVSLVADAKGTDLVVKQWPRMGDWRVLAAAAVVVLTVGLSAWWAVRGGAGVPTPRADGRPAPIATPAVGPAVADASPWASLGAAPDVRLPADLFLTMRGAGGDRDAFLKEFGEAIAPYRAGRFAEAAAALAPVAERYPEIGEVYFYLGTARLYGGAPAEAVAPLRRARGSEVVGDEARWLEAVALQRAGEEGVARAALQALCTEGGRDRERACAIVK